MFTIQEQYKDPLMQKLSFSPPWADQKDCYQSPLSPPSSSQYLTDTIYKPAEGQKGYMGAMQASKALVRKKKIGQQQVCATKY